MTFWKGKRVFVTGCSGLIGGPLCKILLAGGAQVLGYDLDSEGTLRDHGIHGRFNIAKGDVMELDHLQAQMYGQDIIFHLAANSNVEASRQNGYRALETNIMGTLNVLEAARINEAKAVVIASSNHIYGWQPEMPYEEDAPLRQLDTYSVSKICADYLARAYAHNYGVPTAVVRSTNCYGYGDPHTGHLIPSTILSLLRDEQPVINGDGKRSKSYLYVTDVAEAFLRVAHYAVEGQPKGLSFNVSTDPITVLDLVNTIIRVMGKDVEPIILGNKDDQHDEWLDSSRLKAATWWEPNVSLEDGIRTTAAYYKAKQEAQLGVSNRSG